MIAQNLEDKLTVSVSFKPECVGRLEIFYNVDPTINPATIFPIAKNNSSCYNCPIKNEACTFETVKPFYNPKGEFNLFENLKLRGKE